MRCRTKTTDSWIRRYTIFAQFLN